MVQYRRRANEVAEQMWAGGDYLEVTAFGGLYVFVKGFELACVCGVQVAERNEVNRNVAFPHPPR